MRWIEAAIAAKSGEIDGLCAELTALGVEGMSIEDEEDFKSFLENNHKYWDYVDDALNERFSGLSCVKFYLQDDENGQKQLAEIKSALGREIEIGYLDDQDWENSWKSYYEPLPIGEKLLIVPEWMEAVADRECCARQCKETSLQRPLLRCAQNF